MSDNLRLVLIQRAEEARRREDENAIRWAFAQLQLWIWAGAPDAR